MPKLRFFSTSGKWEEYELGEKTTIGRHPDQDLQLLDRMVSKEHAEIERTSKGTYILRDVGSRNGTTLNDESIESPCVLRHGDDIGLGNHILKFIDSDDNVKNESSALGKDSPEQNADAGEGRPDYQKLMERLAAVQNMPSIRKRMSDTRFLPESEIYLEKDLRQDYEKLRVAMELSAEASATVDFDRLLEIIIDKAFKLFNADRAAILLRDEDGQMQTRLAVDRNKKPINHFKISETLLEEVIFEKSAVLSGDALQDQRFSSSNSLVVDNVRSTMCVPLLYEGDVLGVINLDTQMMTGAFMEKDLLILTGFARQAAFTLQQARMIEETRKNAVIRENLRRIISPHLINDVMSGKLQLQKSGRRTESTVLFADIRGFSNMTEDNEPETIVNMLNDFFERMVECIFRHEGALDKFVGDEVMAVWGVNVNRDTHAQSAVQCALEMMKAVDDLNQEREDKGLAKFQIGIGIATGLMIAGYMGSTQAMSYTVIGDTVNLGARLCSAAQPGEILINGEAWRRINNNDNIDTISLPPIMVKGKRDPVEVYRVLR